MSRNAAILAYLFGTLMAAVPILVAWAEPPVPLCKDYAERYAQQQTSGGILKGGIVGSGVGAAIGALAGGAAAGAAIGGGLGLIGGGAKKIFGLQRHLRGCLYRLYGGTCDAGLTGRNDAPDYAPAASRAGATSDWLLFHRCHHVNSFVVRIFYAAI